MNAIRRLALCAVLGSSFVAPLAQAQNIAVVNGKPVPKQRVDLLMNQARKQAEQAGQPLPPGLDKRAAEEVVLREVYVQEAQRQGVARLPAFQEQLEQTRQALMISALFDDYRKRVQISDAEIKQEYDKVKAENSAPEYKSRHILVPTEKEAQDILAKLQAGSSFEDLAKQFSKDPGSAVNGGDLGWSTADAYVPAFGQTLAKLQKGQTTSQAVKSEFGFHIIRLDDSRSGQFPPLNEIKDNVADLIRQQKLDRYRIELKKSAHITGFSFPADPAK